MNNDSFEFVNEELLTLNLTLDNSDEFTIPYTFTNSILNIKTFDNNYAPIADGSIDEIKRQLVIVFFNEGLGSGSHSTFGLLKDNEIFPLSFESTKVNHHDFKSLDDIKENDNLYLFTREYIFKQ